MFGLQNERDMKLEILIFLFGVVFTLSPQYSDAQVKQRTTGNPPVDQESMITRIDERTAGIQKTLEAIESRGELDRALIRKAIDSNTAEISSLRTDVKDEIKVFRTEFSNGFLAANSRIDGLFFGLYAGLFAVIVSIIGTGVWASRKVRHTQPQASLQEQYRFYTEAANDRNHINAKLEEIQAQLQAPRDTIYDELMAEGESDE